MAVEARALLDQLISAPVAVAIFVHTLKTELLNHFAAWGAFRYSCSVRHRIAFGVLTSISFMRHRRFKSLMSIRDHPAARKSLFYHVDLGAHLFIPADKLSEFS